MRGFPHLVISAALVLTSLASSQLQASDEDASKMESDIQKLAADQIVLSRRLDELRRRQEKIEKTIASNPALGAFLLRFDRNGELKAVVSRESSQADRSGLIDPKPILAKYEKLGREEEERKARYEEYERQRACAHCGSKNVEETRVTDWGSNTHAGGRDIKTCQKCGYTSHETWED